MRIFMWRSLFFWGYFTAFSLSYGDIQKNKRIHESVLILKNGMFDYDHFFEKKGDDLAVELLTQRYQNQPIDGLICLDPKLTACAQKISCATHIPLWTLTDLKSFLPKQRVILLDALLSDARYEALQTILQSLHEQGVYVMECVFVAECVPNFARTKIQTQILSLCIKKTNH